MIEKFNVKRGSIIVQHHMFIKVKNLSCFLLNEIKQKMHTLPQNDLYWALVTKM